MPITKVTEKQLERIYEGLTARVVAECEFVTEHVGGQPATDEALRAFCKHHLKLSDDELEAAVARIKNEEIGERDMAGEGDEVKEKESYGLNVIRRDRHGPWVGIWMIKANLKCAASRFGIFTKKRGSKGDLAEMGRIRAFGASKRGRRVERVYLYKDGGVLPDISYEKFMGSVHTPQGRMSIVHDSEVAAPGTRFCYELRFPPAKLAEKDLLLIFSAVGIIGVGSVRSLERSKFKVIGLEIEYPE